MKFRMMVVWQFCWAAVIFGAASVFTSEDCAGQPASQDAKGTSDFAIVGYVPEYRVDLVDPILVKSVTDLVFFSARVNAAGRLDFGKIKPDHLKKMAAWKKEHRIRLLLCVGGWERSAGFSKAAENEMSRREFAKSLEAYCIKNQFDGVDLDWEHPANDLETAQYGLLLQEVKTRFAPRKLLLTIAMAGWQMLPREGISAVDRIHLMAYDAPERHSTLEVAKTDLEKLERLGVPPKKICLGLPFYGRGITRRDDVKTYAEIVRQSNLEPGINEIDGLYFNGPDLIAEKTKLAQARQLAGVMIWELGQDASDDKSLTKLIRRVVDEKR